MTTIATAGGPTGNTSATGWTAAAMARTASKAGTGAKASNSATNVQLSDLAKMLMAAFTGQAASADDVKIPASFDAMVTERTNALASTLMEKFAEADIPVDLAISLQVDKFGTIHAEGAYKKKIEKFFKENPDIAEEVKTVATLNALKATAEALRLYNEEKKAAASKEERDRAFDRYTARLGKIQSLSGTLTLKDGKLTSAAVEYADSLSSPAGEAERSQSGHVNLVA